MLVVAPPTLTGCSLPPEAIQGGGTAQVGPYVNPAVPADVLSSSAAAGSACPQRCDSGVIPPFLSLPLPQLNLLPGKNCFLETRN